MTIVSEWLNCFGGTMHKCYIPTLIFHVLDMMMLCEIPRYLLEYANRTPSPGCAPNFRATVIIEDAIFQARKKTVCPTESSQSDSYSPKGEIYTYCAVYHCYNLMEILKFEERLVSGRISV